jgi:ribonuclease P/MRP protein subunit RPP1
MNERKFYDLNVAFESDRAAIIRRAKELDLSGICLVHTYKCDLDLENYLKEIDKLRKMTDIDLISGVMLKGEEIEKTARKIRRKVDIILALGGEYSINRIACSSDYIDILSCPEKGRRDCGLDQVCCKEAKDHSTIIELNFNELLKLQGSKRIPELHMMKELVRLCLKSGAPFIVNSGAGTIWELRGGRELSALSCVLGAGSYPSITANSEIPERIIMQNRQKKEMPLKGVQI